jgi:hypothetical protein
VGGGGGRGIMNNFWKRWYVHFLERHWILELKGNIKKFENPYLGYREGEKDFWEKEEGKKNIVLRYEETRSRETLAKNGPDLGRRARNLSPILAKW